MKSALLARHKSTYVEGASLGPYNKSVGHSFRRGGVICHLPRTGPIRDRILTLNQLIMQIATTITDDAICTFEAAAAANLKTSSRRGNVVTLPTVSEGEIFVTADLHGNRLNFDRILEITKLDTNPKRHLVLQEVCHGGPSFPDDGGCMSHLMLEDVARLKCEFPERVHFLLSNHELSEATDFCVAKAGRMLNMHFRTGLSDMYGARVDDVHRAITQFILSCPIAIRFGGVFVSHSLPARVDHCPFFTGVLDEPWTPEDLSPDGAVFRMVWGRDFRRENAAAFAEMVDAKVLIHGHEPCPTGYQVPNELQVIIDGCGAHACYLPLPLDRDLAHGDIVKRITRLHT